MYHLCENSQLQTLTCPSGKAFNYVTSKCEDATTVDCRETTEDHAHHHHHKRAAIQQQLHTIDIRQYKAKFQEARQMIKPILHEAFKDVAPSIYSKLERTYLPALREIQSEALPFFREKVYPELQKWMQYLLRMSGMIVEKAYKSYELSNSTHITFVSVSDIIEEVSNDVQPVLRLGRYLSTQFGNKDIHVRNKRESPPIPDFMFSLISPFINNMLKSFASTIVGYDNSFTGKVIMPTIYDMFGNAESRYYLLGLWVSAKSAYSPLLWEMVKRQTYDTPEGTIINIPRHMFDEANEKFRTGSKPFLYKLAAIHLPTFLRRASENVPVLLDGISQLDEVGYKHTGVLKDAIMHFVVKHGAVLQNSTYSHISTYTLTEIMNDLRPIKMNLLQILVEYYKSNKDSIFNLLFGPDSIIKKTVMPPEVYAEPQNPPPKPQKVKDSKLWDNY